VAEDDGVVVERKHLEGTAHKSGQVENGDMVVAVNGTPVGVDLELAGRLIRGPAGTTVSLALRKVACAGVQGAQGAQGARVEVELERRLLPDHPMGPQQASSLW
jgi:C-terminal processing protease CtpA/Prc